MNGMNVTPGPAGGSAGLTEVDSNKPQTGTPARTAGKPAGSFLLLLQTLQLGANPPPATTAKDPDTQPDGDLALVGPADGPVEEDDQSIFADGAGFLLGQQSMGCVASDQAPGAGAAIAAQLVASSLSGAGSGQLPECGQTLLHSVSRSGVPRASDRPVAPGPDTAEAGCALAALRTSGGGVESGTSSTGVAGQGESPTAAWHPDARMHDNRIAAQSLPGGPGGGAAASLESLSRFAWSEDASRSDAVRVNADKDQHTGVSADPGAKVAVSVPVGLPADRHSGLLSGGATLSLLGGAVDAGGSGGGLTDTLRMWVGQALHSAQVQLDRGTDRPVEIQVSVNGREAQVVLLADMPEVRQALQSNAAQLRDLLSNQGLTLSGMAVDVFTQGRGSAQSQTAHAWQQANAPTHSARVQLDPLLAPATTTGPRAGVLRGLVDIFA